MDALGSAARPGLGLGLGLCGPLAFLPHCCSVCRKRCTSGGGRGTAMDDDLRRAGPAAGELCSIMEQSESARAVALATACFGGGVDGVDGVAGG